MEANEQALHTENSKTIHNVRLCIEFCHNLNGNKGKGGMVKQYNIVCLCVAYCIT